MRKKAYANHRIGCRHAADDFDETSGITKHLVETAFDLPTDRRSLPASSLMSRLMVD